MRLREYGVECTRGWPSWPASCPQNGFCAGSLFCATGLPGSRAGTRRKVQRSGGGEKQGCEGGRGKFCGSGLSGGATRERRCGAAVQEVVGARAVGGLLTFECCKKFGAVISSEWVGVVTWNFFRKTCSLSCAHDANIMVPPAAITQAPNTAAMCMVCKSTGEGVLSGQEAQLSVMSHPSFCPQKKEFDF